MVLEATIGFNRRSDNDEEAPEDQEQAFESAGSIKFSSQDQRFLKALKIAIDE